MDSSLSFFYPQAIMLKEGKNYPIFHFTEELRQAVPNCNWTIIGKPPAMLDCHVAEIYQKETYRLNEQIERNKEYFKEEWRFQPTIQEWNILKSIVQKSLQEGIASCDTLSQVFGEKAFSNTPPWFYTAQGIDMAAFFQKTPAAKQYAIFIVESFQQFKEQFRIVQKKEELGFSLKKQLPEIISEAISGDRYLIRAVVNEIDLLKTRITFLEQQLKPLIGSLAFPNKNIIQVEHKPDPYISLTQVQKLRKLVQEKSKTRKQITKIWSLFKREFDLTRYIHLPKEKFDEACEWIKNYTPEKQT